MSITYARETDLSVEDFASVLADTALGPRRPLANSERLATMLTHANFVLTARDEAGALIGVARCLTDFSWACYVSELAVRESAQGLGIGKALLATARGMLGPKVAVVLLATPDAAPFYERIGMEKPPAYMFPRTDRQ